MINIVNSLKVHRKTIVMIAALSVIVLYILPVDQLVDAVSGGNDKIKQGKVKLQSEKDKDNCDNGNGNHFGHCYKITG